WSGRSHSLHGHSDGLSLKATNNDGQPPHTILFSQYHSIIIGLGDGMGDRKSTRLNSSHVKISYAVFCLKKKKPHCLLERLNMIRKANKYSASRLTRDADDNLPLYHKSGQKSHAVVCLEHVIYYYHKYII